MRIAVVGSGISGLGAAYVLRRAHDVTCSSATPRAGGHTNTIAHDGLALDTGFIVHNARNYPLLARLLRRARRARRRSRRCRSRLLRELRARVLRPPAVRAAAERGEPALHALLWEIGRWLRTARRSLDERDYEQHSLERLPRRARATRAASAATSSCRSRPRSGRPRPAARSSSPPPTRSASSTTTACSASAGSRGGRSRGGSRHLRARARATVSARACDSASALGRSGATPTASS